MLSSTSRALSHEPSPPPIAPGLPTIDFGYDELRDKMSSFYVHFDAFVDKTQRKVLAGKNEYERQLAENQESQKHISQDIANTKSKNKEALVAREKEEKEEKDAEGLVREMKMKERSKAQYLAGLEESIAELKAQVEKKVEKREEKRRWLEKQQSKNVPELQFWESILGMRIEGVEMGCLRIVFTNIHAKRWDKEYDFVFRLDQKEYEVLKCRPELPAKEIQRIVDDVNDTRNFTKMLKDMRTLFVNQAKHE